MKLTIIVDDSHVYVDGLCKFGLDISSCEIPVNVHALQWKDSAGWIEFKDNVNGTKPSNQSITSLPDWANSCVTAWESYIPPEAPAVKQNQPIPTVNL